MKNIHDMNPDELRNHIAGLRRLRAELLRSIAAEDGEPEPEPEKPLKLPTKRMRRAVERFDEMSDDEQRRYIDGLF